MVVEVYTPCWIPNSGASTSLLPVHLLHLINFRDTLITPPHETAKNSQEDRGSPPPVAVAVQNHPGSHRRRQPCLGSCQIRRPHRRKGRLRSQRLPTCLGLSVVQIDSAGFIGCSAFLFRSQRTQTRISTFTSRDEHQDGIGPGAPGGSVG